MPESEEGRGHPTVNQGLCTGCGSCAELCPAVFAMDEDGEVAFVHDPLARDPEGLREAMACCPEDCIDWTE